MLKSCLCDYTDAYIIVETLIEIIRTGENATAWVVDRNNK